MFEKRLHPWPLPERLDGEGIFVVGFEPTASETHHLRVENCLVRRCLLRKGDYEFSNRPSFPHVFSGNPGEILTRPPTKTFGVTTLETLNVKEYRHPAVSCGVVLSASRSSI